MKQRQLKIGPLVWLVATTLTLLAVGLLAFLLFFKNQPDPKTVFYNTLDAQLSWQQPIVRYSGTQAGSDYRLEQTVQYNQDHNRLIYTARNQLEAFDVGHLKGLLAGEVRCDLTAAYYRDTELKPPFTVFSPEVETVYKKFIHDNRDTWQRDAACEPQNYQYKNTLLYQGFGLPIGQLPADKRAEVVTDFKQQNTFKVNFEKTKRQYKDGDLIYTYQVKLPKEKLLSILKKHFPEQVEAFVQNYIQPTASQPVNLVDSSAFNFELSVDSQNFQLREVRMRTNPTVRYPEGFADPTELKQLLTASPYGKQPVDSVYTFEYSGQLWFEVPETIVDRTEMQSRRQRVTDQANTIVQNQARTRE